MRDQEILTSLKNNLKSNYSLDSEYTEGDGTEYGEPSRISGIDYNTGHYVEVSSKIGNSWYFSGCDGVRILAYGRKKGKSQWFSEHYRLLDVTGDSDTIWAWLKNHYGVTGCDSDIHKERESIKKSIKTVLINSGMSKLLTIEPVSSTMIASPRIQYAFNDLDEYWESLVLDIRLPNWKEAGKVETSLIIQTRKDMETGDIRNYWTVRKLRVNSKDNIKTLEELNKEKELDLVELTTWLELYVKNECKDILEGSSIRRQKESCAALITRLDKD